MAENREIYFYNDILNNLMLLLKVNERGLIDDLNYNIGYKDEINDFHICAQQKYYDTSESEWVYPTNSFGEIHMYGDVIFQTGFGLQDQFLVVPIPISEDGILALDESFTAISLVGCLNELMNTIGSYWTKDGHNLYPTDLMNCIGMGTVTPLLNVGTAAGNFYIDAGTTGLHIKSRQIDFNATAFLILEGFGEGANGHGAGRNGSRFIMCGSNGDVNSKMMQMVSGGVFTHFDS